MLRYYILIFKILVDRREMEKWWTERDGVVIKLAQMWM